MVSLLCSGMGVFEPDEALKDVVGKLSMTGIPSNRPSASAIASSTYSNSASMIAICSRSVITSVCFDFLRKREERDLTFRIMADIVLVGDVAVGFRVGVGVYIQ